MVCPVLQGDSWKGNFIFWSIHGKLISKEAKAVPHDISSPFSEHSIVSWRALGIPCDVTTVVTTPVPLGHSLTAYKVHAYHVVKTDKST